MSPLRVVSGLAVLLLASSLALGQSLVDVREHRRPAEPGSNAASPQRGPNGPRSLARPSRTPLVGKSAPLRRPPVPDREPAFGGGSSRRPTNAPAPPVSVFLKKHHLGIRIVDGVAVTEIDQTYHNNLHTPMEGTYVCPIPKHAILDRLSIFLGKKEIRGVVMERTRARREYDRIVHRKRDPGLVELIPADKPQIRVSIFPIPARGDMRVKIRYAHVLGRIGRHGATPLPLRSLRNAMGPPIEEFGVDVQARSSWPLRRLVGRGIDLAVTKMDDGRFFSGSLAKKDYRPVRDASIRIVPGSEGPRIALHTHRTGKGETFFMAVLRAGSRPVRDVSLHFDRVGTFEVYPAEPRTVGAGREELWFGRFEGREPTLLVRGRTTQGSFEHQTLVQRPATTADENSWVAGFWALAKTDAILGATGRRAVTLEQAKEVIDLGVRYGVLTRYTSILAR